MIAKMIRSIIIFDNYEILLGFVSAYKKEASHISKRSTHESYMRLFEVSVALFTSNIVHLPGLKINGFAIPVTR